MPSRYVPGTPNPWFPTHPYHGIPIHRNIGPVGGGKLHHFVGPAATVQQGIVVDMLTPEHLWATFQTEAENVLKADGKWILDSGERNKRINAAYARLWLADPRFQWAGLAAFASKQVGCGLLHARGLAQKSRDDLRSVVHWAGSSTEAAAMSAMPTMIGNGADYLHERLGFGNKCLFLDIYPLHRFYMERGWKEFNTYLKNRQNIKARVNWDAGQRLHFGTPFREVREGFEAIEAQATSDSVKLLAWHEQVNILQPILYDDKSMQDALAKNQLAWALRFPSGVYMEIQLTLSAQCKAREGWTAYFSNRRAARLWVANERMAFVLRAAQRFDELLRGTQQPDVKNSLESIAAGGGVA